MKGVFRFIVCSLPVLVLLVCGVAMAGGGHNSTSPALGAVQLASILCNVSSGNSPQGYLRNNSLNGLVGAAQLRQSRLCKSLVSHHSSQNHKRKHQATGCRCGRGGHRPSNRSTVAVNSAQQPTDSRDSFKQEAWFMHDGGKQRRVTKHQARKQGWAGPEAMQTTHQSSLSANPPTPTAPTDKRLKVQLQSPDSLPASGRMPEPVSQLSTAQPSLVTDCPECDSVETGTRKAAGQTPVPLKMLRNHGVIAIPRFEPGSDSAAAEADTAPKILIKTFRVVDGVMQPDTRFSDDGIEDFAVPLPAGNRVTAFTLNKDKLVLLSRPEVDQGLSRVTLININQGDSTDLIDNGVSSGLWVKGELFRFHDNNLYTVSWEEQKMFLYPDLKSDSTQSLSSTKVVDLSSVNLQDGELMSALADSERFHVAVRRPDPESDAHRIHLYQIDEAGGPTKETVITGAGAKDDVYQLDFAEGGLVLSKVPSVNPDIGDLAFPDSADKERIGKQVITGEDSESVDRASYESRKKRLSSVCTTQGSGLISYIGCTPVEGSVRCSCSSSANYPIRCIRYKCKTEAGYCDCDESWKWIASEDPPYGYCGYVGTATCDTFSHSKCYGSLTNTFLTDETTCLENGTAGSAPEQYGCFLNAQKSTGPAAIVVAVSAGLGTACLTAGFLGCEGKKRSGHDAPMEQNDDLTQM
ncbi:hypothetical protein [Sansalvadorimonas verongulae]|uniref:hypothetical protein n=1 Tax=Sansalvadorimonas verongulae TaxID=2172824 RepID=UPI0012BB8D39|nr:hypothetical protein [Sansalvadorimonas verongulae]MTI13883.1 hypothetical protein [Sansalvadorimonas verongulae]